MTIEELKRLKPLDITKLDKSQWEDANAVLGVDSNDDVVMATPEDFAKESEIQEIISDINDIRTSITSGDTETLESAKAYTDDKLGDYYTKNEVEEKIDEATSGITVDAYTKAEADARFQPIGDYATEAYVTAATADFVTSGDVETQVSDFTYSKEVIDEKVAGGGSFDPTQYYTKTEVDNEISAATQDLVTSGEVETQITSKGYATTGYVDSAISGISIPTKTSDLTNDSGFITESALSGLASETYVDNATSGKVDSSTFNTYTGDTATVLEGKADTSDIPDVSNFVTSGDVETQITEKGYATTTYVDNAVSSATVDMATTGDVATAVSGLASESYVTNAITAATDDMATQTWVNNQGFLTQHQDISGKLDVSVFTGYTGATETVLESKADITDIPDVSGFVTSGDVETQITSKGYATEAYVTAATADMATTGDVASAVSGLASENYVDAAITAATDDMATQTWVQNQGYLTQHQDISGKLDTTVFTGYTASTETVLAGKANTSDIPDVSNFVTSGDVATQVSDYTYSKAVIDEKVASGGTFDPTQYYTKTQVDNAISSATEDLASEAYVTAATADFVTSGDVETQITSKNYATTGYVDSAVSGLASESYVTNAITAATSDFVTSGEVETQITGKGYITESALVGYATEAYVTAATEDMATTGDVQTAVSGLASESYVTNAVTAATDDMATQTWVGQQGFLTEHQDISGKLDTSVFTGYTASTETVLESKADVTDIPDVSGFVTSGDVETQITAATQNFVTSGDVESQITGKGYATTSYVDNGLADKADKVKTSTTTITILDTTSDEWETNKLGAFHLTSIEGVLANETAANSNVFSCGGVGYISSEGDDVTLEIGQSTTLVEGSGLIRADEAGYYILDTRGSSPVLTLASGLTTTVEFDVVYEDDLAGYASEAYVTAATQNFVTSGDVETQITAATQNFVTSGDVETQITSKNYATTGYVDSAVSGLASENYVDSAITAATADMATTGDVAAKQDILVSGTNIKTINNQSILGSGNIEIQGGGGTGGTEYYAGTNISIDGNNYINVTGITSQVNTYWVDGGSSQYVESGTGYDLYTTYVESSGHDVMSANTDVRIFSSRIYGQSTNQSYYLQQHDVDQWYGITNTGSSIEIDTVYDMVDAGTDSSNLTNPIVVSGFTDYFDVYYCFDMVNMKFWASKTIKYSVTGPQSLVYGTMPYAQDGSPKKGYIYDAGQYGKRVVSRAEISAAQQNGKLGVQNNLYFWGNSSSSESTNTVFLPTATASADGVMSAGDKSRFNDINSSLAVTSAYTIGSSTSGDTDEYYFEINSTNYYFNKTNVSGVYVLSYTPSSTDTWFYVHSNSDDGQGGTQMKMWQWSETFITDASSFPIEKSLTENWSGSYINFGSFASQMYFIWDTNNNVMLFKTDLNYVSGYKTIATTDQIPTNTVSSTDVTNIVKISQSDYDNLQTKSATTLYIII